MLFKDTSYLELWQPFCLAEQNHLCNFGRTHHGEHFCEITLNLDQEMLLKNISYLELWFSRTDPFVQFWYKALSGFLIYSSGGPPAQRSGSICAILVQGNMGNIHVKLFEIWTSGSGGDILNDYAWMRDRRRTTDKDRSQ